MNQIHSDGDNNHDLIFSTHRSLSAVCLLSRLYPGISTSVCPVVYPEFVEANIIQHRYNHMNPLSSLPPKYAKPQKQLQETSIGIVSFQRKDPSDLINLLDFTISRVCLAMHLFSFVCFFDFCFSFLFSLEQLTIFSTIFSFNSWTVICKMKPTCDKEAILITVNHPLNRPNLPLLGDQSLRFHHLVPSP